MLIYGAIIFLLVTLVSVSVIALLFPNKSQQRLQELVPSAEESNWVKKVVTIAGPLAKLSSPEGDWETSPLRIKFINAGIRSANAPILFYAAKTLLPLVFSFVGYFVLRIADTSLDANTLILYLLIIATIGCYLPNILLSHAISARKREIFENFPDAVDLMLVCVEAGLRLDAAVVRV